MKDFAKQLYNSAAWDKLRQYVRRRDLGLCQDCLRRGIYKPGDAVHHIIPLTAENISNEQISLNPDNLVLVCKECHEKRHELLGEGVWGQKDGFHKHRRFEIDPSGRVRRRQDR